MTSYKKHEYEPYHQNSKTENKNKIDENKKEKSFYLRGTNNLTEVYIHPGVAVHQVTIVSLPVLQLHQLRQRKMTIKTPHQTRALPIN